MKLMIIITVVITIYKLIKITPFPLRKCTYTKGGGGRTNKTHTNTHAHERTDRIRSGVSGKRIHGEKFTVDIAERARVAIDD